MELERVFHRCDGVRHDADVGKYFGVLLPTLTEQLVAETWEIGAVVSAMTIATDVSGK